MPRLAHPKENTIRHLILISTCFGLALIGCAPSPEIVATAIAQTQAAMPTETFTPVPSLTATLTFTPEPPTSTPTEIPTSTPDLQVITADPEELACTKADLPAQGSYVPTLFDFHSGSHVTHNTNASVVKHGGPFFGELLKDYIRDTGRIDGWWLDFKKNDPSYSGFSYILCLVAKFQTATGAQLAVQKYNDVEIFGKPYEYLDSERSVGDLSVAISYVYYAVSSTRIFYEVDYSYRNYRVTIIGHGDARVDDLYDVGEKILQKLKDAPLSLP